MADEIGTQWGIWMNTAGSAGRTEFRRRLYSFTLRLIQFLDKLPGDNTSRRLGDQLLRGGTSIIGNFVEGQSASSKRDFTNYFTTALKSANESKLWMALLRDSGRVRGEECGWFMNELEEFSKIFASSILTLKGKRRG
ncbi:MAG TPA: four helix bundle protein [Bacteroidota bacterium]|nr:four helix bundle protein [Bacteroidota bacterium]